MGAIRTALLSLDKMRFSTVLSRILCSRRILLFSKPRLGEPVLEAKPLKENRSERESSWSLGEITHKSRCACRNVYSTFVFHNRILLRYSIE